LCGVAGVQNADGGAISILSMIGLSYRPPLARRPGGTPIFAIKARGLVRPCPACCVPKERNDMGAIPVASPLSQRLSQESKSLSRDGTGKRAPVAVRLITP